MARIVHWRHQPSLRKAHNAARRGIVAVEMALLAPVFFVILMGSIETCLILGAQQLLENAAFNTSRLAKTGYVISGQTQGQTVSQILSKELSSYGNLFDMTNVTMTTTDYTSFAGAQAGGGAGGYGTAQQIVVYTVTYPWKLFTPMLASIVGTRGVLNLSTNIVVRNEPY